MRRLLSSALRLLLYTNIWVALCMAVLMMGFVHAHHLAYPWHYGLFAFTATFATYNFHRLVRLQKLHDTAADSPRTRWLNNHRLLLLLSAILAAVIASVTLLFLQHDQLTFIVTGAMGLVIAGYVFGTRFRPLREWAGMKNIWISCVWSGVLLLPLLPYPEKILPAEFLAIALLVYVAIIPFDIRDLPYDPEHMRTIPQLFGKRGAQILGTLLVIPALLSLSSVYDLQTSMLLPVVSQIGALMLVETNASHSYLPEFIWESPLLFTGICYFTLG